MSATLTKNEFGISDVLKQLGLKENNYGASTGLNHFSTKGKKIDSELSATHGFSDLTTILIEADVWLTVNLL